MTRAGARRATRRPSRSTRRSGSTSPTALTAFTRGSAYVNHDDDAGDRGRGMRADLAVLDRNPFDGLVDAIAETNVEMTLASGRVVHGG